MDTEAITTEEMAAPAPPAPNSSRAAWIVAGVATAVALIAAMVAVSAVMRDDDNVKLPAGFQSAGFMRPVTGEITSIDGDSFKVKETAPNGIVTTSEVDTTSKTTFRQSVSGSLSDLAVGDTVAITGATADNVLNATRITETAAQTNIVRGDGPKFVDGGPAFRGDGGAGARGGPPQVFRAGGGNGRVGTIAKIEGDTITLDAFDGESVVVKTTATTDVRVNRSITMKQLKVGDAVRVFGPMEGSTITATEVTKGVINDDALAS